MKVAIVGAGSAGIFTAYRLANIEGVTVDLFEKGNSIENRTRNEVMSGFGGAGAFSDGKLTLTTEFGGWLTDFFDEESLSHLINEADDIWKKFSGVYELDSSNNYEKIKDLEYLCSRHSLRLYAAKIRHLGTDNCLLAIKNIQHYLQDTKNITIFFNALVTELIIENGSIKGIITSDGTKRYYDVVVLAVGRSGNYWIQ